MNRKYFAITLLLISFVVSGLAQSSTARTHRKLEADLQEMIRGFEGDIGIYVKDLRSGKVARINADTVFPTASIVKVPILITIMDKIEKGELKYHDHLTWLDTLKYDPGEDIAGYLKPGTPIELSKVIMLMMTISDNNASLWLQQLAGTGTAINQLMESLGYSQTRVNSRTPGREAFRSMYGWGQTTPREMAQLFEAIVEGKIVSANASSQMLRIMSRQYWDEEALSAIPAGIFTADKNGAVNRSRSEVLYVKAKRPYIFSIFTKNNKDESWEKGNAAWELTRKLSAYLFQYFNQ